jgi:hypothetical protein
VGYYDPMPADGAAGWGGWLRGAVNGIPAYDIGPGGTADDTTALQAAFNAVNSIGGGIVMGRPNTVYTGLDVSWAGSNITLAGNGLSTIFKMKAGTVDNHYLFGAVGTTTDTTGNLTNIGIRDCQLLGTVTTDAFVQHRHLLCLSGVSGCRIENVLFKGWQGDAVYLGHIGGNERHQENVVIDRATFDGVNQDNRNCISGIDCTGFRLMNSTLMNSTRSDMPGAVDFEPNSGFTWVKIRDIKVANNLFQNVRAGIAGVVAFVLHDSQAAYTTDAYGWQVVGNGFVDCTGSNALVYATQAQTMSSTVPANQLLVRDNWSNGIKPYELDGVRGVTARGNDWGIAAKACDIGFTNECRDIGITGDSYRGVTGGNGFVIYKATDLAVEDCDLLDFSTGNVLRLTVGSGSVGNSDRITMAYNRLRGTGPTAWGLKDAAHTVTSTANNQLIGNRLNGLAAPTTIFAAGGSNTALNL